MKVKTRRSLVGLVLLLATVLVTHAEADESAKVTRICAVSQSWEAKDRNLAHVLDILDRAAAQRAEIVCLPQDCVPTDGGASAKAALDAIAHAAAERKMFVACQPEGKGRQQILLDVVSRRSRRQGDRQVPQVASLARRRHCVGRLAAGV